MISQIYVYKTLPALSLIFFRVSASLTWAWIWARSSCIFLRFSTICLTTLRLSSVWFWKSDNWCWWWRGTVQWYVVVLSLTFWSPAVLEKVFFIFCLICLQPWTGQWAASLSLEIKYFDLSLPTSVSRENKNIKLEQKLKCYLLEILIVRGDGDHLEIISDK